MNFHEFSEVFRRYGVFSTQDIAKEWPHFNYVNLVNWQDKGYLLKLRNKWYAFPNSIQSEADLFFLANRMHRPSYISLESAFQYYHWIPEGVFSITSVTTLKPGFWATPVGHFTYRSILPRLFFGYRPVQAQHVVFNMAEPEKALLDWLYFHPGYQTHADFESLRFNTEEITSQIDLLRIEGLLDLFGISTMNKRWNNLLKYLSL